jgi:hypothetical protein
LIRPALISEPTWKFACKPQSTNKLQSGMNNS